MRKVVTFLFVVVLGTILLLVGFVDIKTILLITTALVIFLVTVATLLWLTERFGEGKIARKIAKVLRAILSFIDSIFDPFGMF